MTYVQTPIVAWGKEGRVGDGGKIYPQSVFPHKFGFLNGRTVIKIY